MAFDPAHVLPGCLPAAFRGIPFFSPDVRSEHGRRVAEHLFPGVDRAAYDDHGLLPSVVSVEGLMVGDDYQVQARALQGAFERPGPGTLIHPWLGPMLVILVEAAEISFAANELRVARFSATFTRLPAGGLAAGIGAFVSTVAQLADSVAGVAAAARQLVASVR